MHFFGFGSLPVFFGRDLPYRFHETSDGPRNSGDEICWSLIVRAGNNKRQLSEVVDGWPLLKSWDGFFNSLVVLG